MNTQHHRLSRACRARHAQRRTQRGVGLVEGLVSIAVLAFGLLGLARFQVDLFKQSTDARNRLVATGLADALLSYVRVDPLNVACYTVPQVGTCLSPAALATTTAWAAEVAAGGFASASATLVSPTRMTASLTWASHAFGDTRSLEATTDVRP